MLVMVTGGTGFLGGHTVSALVAAGHQVRVFARDVSVLDAVLAPLGVEPEAVRAVAGDVTDEVAVGRAVRGCDAVLHAASVYSFDSRHNRRMLAVNERGTEVVLTAAARAGVSRTVHVSTVVALAPGADGSLDAGSPVIRSRQAYIASKAAAERVAREHQERGEPVAISYPPALLGPDDPYLGDQNARLRNLLRGLMPLWPAGGYPVGDVRDTALMHANLLTGRPTGRGTGRDRWFGPGHYLSTRDYLRVVSAATGRRLVAGFLPARAMLPFGLLTSAVQRIWPWHIPAEYGAIRVCALDPHVDAREQAAGVTPRPVPETVADTVRWLHDEGLLTTRQAGPVAVGGLGAVAF